MSINVEIVKGPTENNISAIRRFTKRVQGSGVLPRVRSLRYKNRRLSPYKNKMRTLESIKRRENIKELIKLGKMKENTKTRR